MARDVYESPLSARYADKEMKYLFSPDMKFRTWRKLWIALAEAEMELGLPVTQAQVDELKAHAEDINYEVAQEREKVVRHDVMSHVYAYGQQCPGAAGIIHLGATSCYVGDNTDVIIMTEALQLIRNKLVGVIRITAETLSGIPSIVYGLFGMLFFVSALKWGYSILAGAFTMSIMILPLIMRTTEEALKSVPDTYREGSFGLGAGKLRTIFRIVLPAAVPGIMAGVILAIGRIMGETAALMYTAGTVPKMASSPMDSGRTLAVHMYNLSSEGLYMDQAYATAVILLIVVVGMNTLSAVAARKLTKGTR